MIKKISLEYLSVALFIIAFFFIYIHMQPQILAGNGYGWDGIEYAKIYRIFSTGIHDTVAFPFCQRVGTPFIASVIGINNDITSFKIVNIFFSFLFSITIYIISRFSGFNYYYSILSVLLTVILFFSPIRFTPFYPVYTDPAFLAFLSLSFYFLIKNKFGTAFLFLVIAYPFREVAIYIAPLFLFFSLYIGGIKGTIIVKFIIAFAHLTMLNIFIAHYMSCEGSQIVTAINGIRIGFSEPHKFVSWSAGISMTAAPLLYIREIYTLSKIQKISVLGFIAAAIFGLVGGSDSTRIFYSFFPMYFLLILSVIQTKGYIFSIFSILGFIITNRFSQKIMEPLHYWPTRDESGFFYQFPDHAMPEVALMILCTWIILFVSFDKLVSSKHLPCTLSRKYQ